MVVSFGAAWPGNAELKATTKSVKGQGLALLPSKPPRSGFVQDELLGRKGAALPWKDELLGRKGASLRWKRGLLGRKSEGDASSRPRDASEFLPPRFSHNGGRRMNK